MTSGEKPSLHHITVSKTARYARLGEPGPKVRDVWIVCHGHAQLAKDFIESFRVIEAPHRLIVAPEALNHYYLDGGFRGASSRVGATWMTIEDREAEIADYVAYLDALHEEIFRVVPRMNCALTVLGFSQGVATVSRWVTTGKVEPEKLILWAGSLPAELALPGASRLNAGGREPMMVVGSEDRFITQKVLDSQLAALSALGVTPSVTTFPGGHEIDRRTLEAISKG